MVELFRAEWMKINGNRFMTSFTVWLFPVGVTFRTNFPCELNHAGELAVDRLLRLFREVRE